MMALCRRRLLAAIPTLFAVAVLGFLLVRLSPGSPFASEKALDASVQAALAARYGLDAPLWQQFVRYLALLAQGDLGPSIKYPEYSVSELIAQAWPHTARLAACAFAWALGLGSLLAVPMALRPHGALGRACSWLATVALSLPSFVLGPLLVLALAGPRTGLPVAGWGEPRHLVLPSLTLGLVVCGSVAKVLAAGLTSALRAPYITAARARGVGTGRLFARHALFAALGPLAAVMGPSAAGLLAGSVAVEQIFLVPGLGPYFVDAATNRDFFLVMGIVLVDALLLLAMNLLADVAVLWCDPRLASKAALDKT